MAQLGLGGSLSNIGGRWPVAAVTVLRMLILAVVLGWRFVLRTLSDGSQGDDPLVYPAMMLLLLDLTK